MSQTCPKHVPNMSQTSQTCPKHAPNMSQTCPKHVPNMSQTCPKHVPNMTKTCPKHVPNMSQTCCEHVPNMSQTCSKNIRSRRGSIPCDLLKNLTCRHRNVSDLNWSTLSSCPGMCWEYIICRSAFAATPHWTSHKKSYRRVGRRPVRAAEPRDPSSGPRRPSAALGAPGGRQRPSRAARAAREVLQICKQELNTIL